MAGVIGNISNVVQNPADAAAINAQMPAVIAFIAVIVVGALFAAVVKWVGRDTTRNEHNEAPGWLDESSSPPPLAGSPAPRPASEPEIIPPSGASVKTASSHASYKLDAAALARIKELKDQGAPIEELCRAANLDYGSMSAMQRATLEKVMSLAVGNMSAFTFSTSFGTKTPSVAGGVESFSESYNFGPEEMARAKKMHLDGAPLDDICRDLSKDYAGWEEAHQKRFQRMVGMMLGIGGMF
jgi:hypothetical protein